MSRTSFVNCPPKMLATDPTVGLARLNAYNLVARCQHTWYIYVADTWGARKFLSPFTDLSFPSDAPVRRILGKTLDSSNILKSIGIGLMNSVVLLVVWVFFLLSPSTRHVLCVVSCPPRWWCFYTTTKASGPCSLLACHYDQGNHRSSLSRHLSWINY